MVGEFLTCIGNGKCEELPARLELASELLENVVSLIGGEAMAIVGCVQD